jgi:hypothetical protein
VRLIEFDMEGRDLFALAFCFLFEFLVSLSWVEVGKRCGERVGIIDIYLEGKYLDGNEWMCNGGV